MRSSRIFHAFCAVFGTVSSLLPTANAQATYVFSDTVGNIKALNTNSWDQACPSGYERITDEDECAVYYDDTPPPGVITHYSYPPGCVNADGLIFFNSVLDVLPDDIIVPHFLNTYKLVCKLSPVTAGAGGDPHVDRFDQETITYQGICDVLFLHSPDGADGFDLAIHARLTAPKRQNTGREYTYISEIAVSIGGNVYEVQSEGAAMFLNGVLHHNHTKYADDTNAIALPTAAPGASDYTLTKTVIGQKKNRIKYTFRFANGSEIELRANIHFHACFIEVRGDFGGTQVEGLLGKPRVPGMFGRDGRLMPKDNVNEYGQEWQVLDTEPHLFVDAHRYPQYPEQCIVVDLNTNFNADKLQLRGSRRNLIEVENGTMQQKQNHKVSKLEAEEACRRKKHFKYCIDDVLAFDNLETAEESYY